ncbi:MAG: hypothetical protein HY293_14960 [Planctomycetes bacterium]|nr:hypothetical protein [Planctomycetota bacterium]
MNPVRFERRGGGQAKGCIVYIVAVPALTFMIWIVVGGSLNWLFTHVLRTTQQTASAIMFAFLPIIFLAVLRGTWQDFRGGKAAVSVSADRIDVEIAQGRRTFPFASLGSILLKPYYDDLAVFLCPVKGRPFKLPPDIASFDAVRDAFEATLIPHLTARLGERLEAGEALRLEESRLLALLRIPWGLLSILAGIPIVATIFHAHLGLDLLKAGPRSIRRGWRGLGGGLEVHSGGLAACSGVVRTPIPWESLSIRKLDDDGLVLASRKGGGLSVSPYAANAWPAARWIAERISRPPA